MPRYDFDIAENGNDFRDEEGTELRGIQDVRRDAAATLLGIAQSYASCGTGIDMAAEVRDEVGLIVARVSLALKVESSAS